MCLITVPNDGKRDGTLGSRSSLIGRAVFLWPDYVFWIRGEFRNRFPASKTIGIGKSPVSPYISGKTASIDKILVVTLKEDQTAVGLSIQYFLVSGHDFTCCRLPTS